VNKKLIMIQRRKNACLATKNVIGVSDQKKKIAAAAQKINFILMVAALNNVHPKPILTGNSLVQNVISLAQNAMVLLILNALNVL
jgi:hypothetical protein